MSGFTKIRGEHPDAITDGGTDATGRPLAKQFDLRVNLFAADGVCTKKMVDLVDSAKNDVVCPEAGMPSEKMPGGAVFKAKYESRFGQPIQIYASFRRNA